MDDEWVDVIDKDGKVLRKVLKSEAHKTGVLHRCVVCEIRDSSGNWILVKQASHKQDAGQYVSPVGGHVKAGETDEQALKREVFEETGITNFKSKLLGKMPFNRKVLGRQENHLFLVYEIYSDQTPIVNEESVHFKAFTEKELVKKLKSSPKEFGNVFFVVLEEFYPDLLK